MEGLRAVWGALLLATLLVPPAAGSPVEPQELTEFNPTGVGSTEAGPANRATRLQGTAFLKRRQWVVGAAVLVRPESSTSLLYVTSTDDKGSFQLDGLPEGSYRVEFRRDGLAPVVKNEITLRFPFRSIVEVAMQPLEDPRSENNTTPPASGAGSGRVRLKGLTRTLEAKPIGEVRVRLVRADGAVDPRTARTGSEGTFLFSDLPTGRWKLEILGVGHLPIRVDLDLREDFELNAVLVPQPANYTPLPLDLIPPEKPIPPPEENRRD